MYMLNVELWCSRESAIVSTYTVVHEIIIMKQPLV